MTVFSDEIKLFIKETPWTFAKTYAKILPHEYIVQEKVDNDSFIELAKHIDEVRITIITTGFRNLI